MTSDCYAIFDTAIGRCGLAWRGDAVLAANLPERDDAAMRARLKRRAPQAREMPPSPFAAAIIHQIQNLAATGEGDLSDIPLVLEGLPEFHQRVYAIALTIKPGLTLTYGEIANRLGEPGAAQAVGQALGRNPFPIIVPCHRVLAAGGKTGGFSAAGGIATKFKLLAIERARTSAEPSLFDSDKDFVLKVSHAKD